MNTDGLSNAAWRGIEGHTQHVMHGRTRRYVPELICPSHYAKMFHVILTHITRRQNGLNTCKKLHIVGKILMFTATPYIGFSYYQFWQQHLELVDCCPPSARGRVEGDSVAGQALPLTGPVRLRRARRSNPSENQIWIH